MHNKLRSRPGSAFYQGPEQRGTSWANSTSAHHCVPQPPPPSPGGSDLSPLLSHHHHPRATTALPRPPSFFVSIHSLFFHNNFNESPQQTTQTQASQLLSCSEPLVVPMARKARSSGPLRLPALPAEASAGGPQQAAQRPHPCRRAPLTPSHTAVPHPDCEAREGRDTGLSPLQTSETTQTLVLITICRGNSVRASALHRETSRAKVPDSPQLPVRRAIMGRRARAGGPQSDSRSTLRRESHGGAPLISPSLRVSSLLAQGDAGCMNQPTGRGGGAPPATTTAPPTPGTVHLRWAHRSTREGRAYLRSPSSPRGW